MRKVLSFLGVSMETMESLVTNGYVLPLGFYPGGLDLYK